MAQQSSAYNYNPEGSGAAGVGAGATAGPSGTAVPGAGAAAGGSQGYMGADGKWVHGPKPAKKAAQGKRETVIRSKGGRVWEDQTLLEWDPCESRPSAKLWLSTPRAGRLNS